MVILHEDSKVQTDWRTFGESAYKESVSFICKPFAGFIDFVFYIWDSGSGKCSDADKSDRKLSAACADSTYRNSYLFCFSVLYEKMALFPVWDDDRDERNHAEIGIE